MKDVSAITNEQIVTEAMANHDKHYWALVQVLKRRRKGWSELADLIGEGSTVASAIWNKYENFDFTEPATVSDPVQPGPRPQCPKCGSQVCAPYKSTETGMWTQRCNACEWFDSWAGLAAPADMEQGWVSVEDRLPEIGQEVIVYCPKKSRRNVTALARFIRWEGAVEFYWDNAYPGKGNCHIQEAVTHWQSLPAAPLEQIESLCRRVPAQPETWIEEFLEHIKWMHDHAHKRIEQTSDFGATKGYRCIPADSPLNAYLQGQRDTATELLARARDFKKQAGATTQGTPEGAERDDDSVPLDHGLRGKL